MAKVFVITGPSGVGKGTLISGLLERMAELELSTSATTREPREGEEDGREYHFLSPDEFAARADAGEFLEHATFSGNRYGTLRSEVERCLEAGVSLVLEIEVQGARQVRAALADEAGADLHRAARSGGRCASGSRAAGPTRPRRSSGGWRPRSRSSRPSRSSSTWS